MTDPAEIILQQTLTAPEPVSDGTGAAVIMADDQSVQMVRVYYPAPLSGSFEGRVVKQSLTIDNAGISVAKLRAEWMASLGHSDNPVAQPEESVPPQ